MVRHDARWLRNFTGHRCANAYHITIFYRFIHKYFISMQFALNNCWTSEYWRKYKVLMVRHDVWWRGSFGELHRCLVCRQLEHITMFYIFSVTYIMFMQVALNNCCTGGYWRKYKVMMVQHDGRWRGNFGELHRRLVRQCLPHITMFYILSVTYIIFMQVALNNCWTGEYWRKYKVMMVRHDGRGVGISANVTGAWCTDGFNISLCFPYCMLHMYVIYMQFAWNHCCTGQHWRKHKVMMVGSAGISMNVTSTWCADAYHISPCFTYFMLHMSFSCSLL
jgi:hypothetical protein